MFSPDRRHEEHVARGLWIPGSRTALAPRNDGCVVGAPKNKIIFLAPRNSAPPLRAYLSPDNNHSEWGDGKAATQARRVHAAGLYPHRRLALSRRVAGRQFQFRAYQAADPETGGRQIRRLLHGGPSGRAEHAGQCAQAQPHRHFVRAVHAIVGAGRRHRADRPDRDRLDHIRRALSRRPPLCLARPYQRRPRGLEHRHHLQSGCGAEFRPRRSHGARRALQAGARIL